MGWAGGSDIFHEVITSAKKFIKDKKARKKFYKNMIAAFESHDWDTQMECFGEDPVYDELMHEMGHTDGEDVEVYEDDQE